jgi:hypothetical protein
LTVYLRNGQPANRSGIANTRDTSDAQLASGMPIECGSQALPEMMMIAFCMMGALAVLVFLSISGEIPNLFRRK